jgi:hypothetical protein
MNPIIPSPPSVQFTEYGIIFGENINYDEWRGMLDSARKARNCYLSFVSDITAYGRKNFGDEKVNAALEQLEFDLSECTKVEFIALVPIEQRAEYGLSAEHAYMLGKLLDTPEERAKWAAITSEHNLTAFELKKSIERGSVIRAAEISTNSGHSTGIASVQSVHFHFLKWQRQFEDRTAILKLPKNERERILNQLTPMVQLAAEIEQSLS